MKKFLLSISALFFVSMHVNAQAWLTIHNNTGCDIEVTVTARESGGPCNPITATLTTPSAIFTIPANSNQQFENLDPAIVDFTVEVVVDPMGTPFSFLTTAPAGLPFRVNHTTLAPACAYPIAYGVPNSTHPCSGGWGWAITHSSSPWPNIEYFIDPI